MAPEKRSGPESPKSRHAKAIAVGVASWRRPTERSRFVSRLADRGFGGLGRGNWGGRQRWPFICASGAFVAAASESRSFDESNVGVDPSSRNLLCGKVNDFSDRSHALPLSYRPGADRIRTDDRRIDLDLRSRSSTTTDSRSEHDDRTGDGDFGEVHHTQRRALSERWSRGNRTRGAQGRIRTFTFRV